MSSCRAEATFSDASHPQAVSSTVIIKDFNGLADVASMKILCSDKTGTLTNPHKMFVESVFGSRGEALVGDEMTDVLRVAALASGAEKTASGDINGNITGTTVFKFAESRGADMRVPAGSIRCPFDSNRKMASIQVPDGSGTAVTYALGSFNEVAERCNVDDFAAIDKVMNQLEAGGLRVLAVARSGTRPVVAVADGKYEEVESGLSFAGFVAFRNDLREGVVKATSDINAAGVDIVVISGDRRMSVVAIANKAGMDIVDEHCVSGTDFVALGEEEQREFFRTLGRNKVIYCASVECKQVAVLRAREAGVAFGEKDGFVVGMVGDGANDVAAMQVAQVAVAMQTGSDAPKELKNVFILKRDNFGDIVAAMAQGRRCLFKFREATTYLVGTNFAEALFPVVCNVFPNTGLPMHIDGTRWLYINTTTDFHPKEMASDPVDYQELLAAGPMNSDLLTFKAKLQVRSHLKPNMYAAVSEK